MKITLNKLRGLIKEALSDEMASKGLTENYMFFSNLKQMKRQIELLMELDEMEVEDILQNGHDWADDHIAVAKNNLDQVFDFIMNETN
jgi:hypothetical protein